MVKILNASNENEIHRVDSPFNEDSKHLDFPNFHCSIVCSYCSIWCCIIKSGSKMVKISNASNENEIHRVDSHFNEDSKHIFLSGRPKFWRRDGQKN